MRKKSESCIVKATQIAPVLVFVNINWGGRKDETYKRCYGNEKVIYISGPSDGRSHSLEELRKLQREGVNVAEVMEIIKDDVRLNKFGIKWLL